MTEEKQNNVCVLPVYRKDQWQALLGDGAKELEDTWEEWNAFSGEMIAGLEGRGIPYVRIPPDLEEIKQFCEEEGIPNDGEARYRLLYQRFNAEISQSKVVSNYRGCCIERECDLFAVRFYQKDPDCVHDFKPWCDSLEEAKQVIDKLERNAMRETATEVKRRWASAGGRLNLYPGE
jgi:hypothetical protein